MSQRLTCWREKGRGQGWSRLLPTKIFSQRRRHWAGEATRAKPCCCRNSRCSPPASSFSSLSSCRCWNPWTDWSGLLPHLTWLLIDWYRTFILMENKLIAPLCQCQPPQMFENDTSANICTKLLLCLLES